MGGTGLEPVNVTTGRTNKLRKRADAGGAESGALFANSASGRSHLTDLAAVLAGLSPADRLALAAMLTQTNATEGGPK